MHNFWPQTDHSERHFLCRILRLFLRVLYLLMLSFTYFKTIDKTGSDNREQKCADIIGTVLVPGLTISNDKL